MHWAKVLNISRVFPLSTRRLYCCLSRMDKVVSLSQGAEEAILERAKQQLERGGVVAVPTDTIYGVAALAQNTAGVSKLYEIKKRDAGKPIAICVGDVSDIGR